MDGQTREEPDMATFVDAASEQATAIVTAIRDQLTETIEALERTKDPAYTRAIRMLLAGEASLDHGLAALGLAKKSKQHEWQERQRAAMDFLELRTTESGREFIVIKQLSIEVEGKPDDAMTQLVSRKRWPGLPSAGKRFRFTLERAPALSGAYFAKRAALETWTHVDGGRWEPAGTMTLQALHRAFLDRAAIDSAPEGERDDLFARPEEVSRGQ
jgi:hypothetical protein